MLNKKTITGLESLLERNLSFKYQPNITHVSFVKTVHSVVTSAHLGLRSLLIEWQKEWHGTEFVIHSWRIPQTRIYYFQITSAHFSIQLIEFVGAYFFQIENNNPEKILHLHINSNARVVKPFETDVSWTFECATHEHDFTQCLAMLIENERKNHPLAFIRTEDVAFLKRLDSLWANLSWSVRENRIVLKDVQNDTTGFAELIAYLLGNLFDDHQEIKTDKLPDGGGWFYKTLISDAAFLQTTKNRLQDAWDTLSAPARKIYFTKAVSESPLEIGAMVILAGLNKFWWYQKLADLFTSALEVQQSPHLALWKLYRHVSDNGFVAGQIKSSKVAIHNTIQKSNFVQFSNARLSWKAVRRNKHFYSHFSDAVTPALSINQEATIVFKTDQQLEIQPFIFQHEFIKHNTCLVKYDGIEIEIALAWTDFVVNISEVRLKFLFKKKRYQLSIKGIKTSKEIAISNHIISFEKQQYHKIYLDLKKDKPGQNLSFFDIRGASLDINSLSNRAPVYLHALLLNRFGQLCKYIHVNRAVSNRNVKIATLANTPEPLDIQSDFSIIIPKSEQLPVNPMINKSLIAEMRMSPAHLLMQQMAIFSSIPEKQLRNVYTLFYRSFGFYVKSYPLEAVNKMTLRFKIAVTDEEISKEEHGIAGLVLTSIEVEKWLRNYFPDVLKTSQKDSIFI